MSLDQRCRAALGVSARLANVIAAAAPFPDRVSSEFFVPDGASNTRDVEPRVRRWLRTVAQDDEALPAIMQHLVTNGQALGAGFRTVRLRDLRLLPSWAESLVAFLASQPGSPDEATSGGTSITPLTSFERAVCALLPRRDGRIEGVAVADEGYKGIVGDLVSRLIEVCDPVMRFELQVSMPGRDPLEWPGTPEMDATEAGWLARLERFPALAFVVGVACRQWRRNVIEILGRLRADVAFLRGEPFGWHELDPLVGFKGGAGDRHADGRSVTLLRFASGRGLVYKPKDLRHVEATMKVITFLNGAGLSLPLASRGTVCRDGYGWEERVDPAPVADRDGFHRFYRRMGMLIRLMQVLNGRDLWADNLIAAGEQPIVTDLECLFSPRLDPPPELPPRRQRLVDRLQTTVLPTAMPLQAWVPSPECATRDVGCLSHAGDPREAGGAALPVAPYRPWMGDETADPWNHADDVSTGYREMYHVLRASRERLLLEDGPLHAFAGVRMRYIWRATSDCHKMLRASVSPTALVDGTARETVLAAVLRGAYTRAARELDVPEIARAEIGAFRLLDVPLFATLTTSSSLFTPEGTEIVGHFAGTAWDEVRRRIAALDEVPIDTDIAILRAAIDAARGGIDLAPAVDPAGTIATVRSPRRDRSEDVEPAADEILEGVHEIADLLLSAREPPLGTGSGWLALLWLPILDLWDVGPAAADLISGALGPALYLAEYFSVSGDPRAWMASRETLDELFELSESSDDASLDRSLSLGATVPGGLAGPGALCYTAGRVSASLADKALFHRARMHVERAAAACRARRVGFDLAFGLAGLQLELLRLRIGEGRADVDLNLLASDLTARLSGFMRDPQIAHNPVPETIRLRELVPMERDGVALALARTIAVAPELVSDRSAVIASLAAHSFDLTRRGGRLAALAVGGCGVRVSGPPKVVRPSLVELLQQGTRALVLRAEEAQFAARCTNDSEAALEARRCIRVLLDRRAAGGRWFPDRLVDDRLNLSALDGMPALGSVLLRHLRPDLPLIGVLE